MRRALLILCAAALSGCVCGDFAQACPRERHPPGAGVTAAAEVYAVGREVTLVLDNCELSAGRSVTSATLELTDPDGTPVPGATFTAPARVEPSSGIYLAYESTVTFTPTAAGQLHRLVGRRARARGFFGACAPCHTETTQTKSSPMR